jgi:hypothetical protein
LPVPAFSGYALATVFTNGIPSASVLVSWPISAITGITPSSGSAGGGTSVTLTGTSFIGASSVTFGGTVATGFTVNSATSITATTPAHPAGIVDVSVTTFAGTGTGTNLFTYTEPDIALEAPTGTAVTNGIGTLAYGSIIPGQTTDLNVTVRNTGSNDLTVISATIIGPDAGQFALVSTPSETLAAGASAAVTLRFSPTTSGAKTATLSIASNDPDENPFILALAGSGLSNTTDTDGDGMNDLAEALMTALGFDWQVNQASLVNTYYTNANAANLHSQAQYDANRTTGRNDVINSPNTYSLYTLSQVQALNVGVPLLAKDPVTGRFKLTMGVQKTNNLATPFVAFPMNTAGTNATINAAGKLEFEFTSPDNAAFFRLETK